MFQLIMADLDALMVEALRIDALVKSSLTADQAAQISAKVKAVLDQVKPIGL